MAKELKELEVRLKEHISSEVGQITKRLDILNHKVAKHEERLNDYDVKRASRFVDCPNRDLIDNLEKQSERAEAVALATKELSKKQQSDMKMFIAVLAVVISLINLTFKFL